MPGDLISALHLDKEALDGRTIIVKELCGCDSSFVVSSLLAYQAKKKCATLLVTFHQLLNHYHQTGLRMGYNLNNQHSAGLIRVVSPAEIFLQNLFDNETNDFLGSMTQLIKEQIMGLVTEKGSQGPVCVCVDGLTHLFDLGYGLKSINTFARTIIQTVRENMSFLVLGCAVVSPEDDTAVLAGLLSHMAYTLVECESLVSGRSADVSGHISVKHPGEKFRPDRQHMMQLATARYHFRLFDRGVKLFAPGFVGL